MITTSIQNLENYKTYLKIEEAAHHFFKKNGYLRLDLPILSPSLIPESYLEVFETEFKYLNQPRKFYLTPSPELFIKRLLGKNIGDCYYLGKSFRNSELESDLHLPEFTMLEFYKTNVDYRFIKKEIARLLTFIGINVFKKTVIKYKDNPIHLGKNWEEISVKDAFSRFAKINDEALFNKEKFKKVAQWKGYQVNGASYVDLFSQIYVQEIEPHLGVNGVPTIIYDYPKEMAALAKLNKDRKTAQRFEFYIAGVELGDCYTELTNAKEQKQRFQEEEKERKKAKKTTHPIDWGFIDVLKKGLPPCSGIAIGFDRLAMIFLGIDDIRKLRLINFGSF